MTPHEYSLCVTELTPKRVLRAAINLSNFLLVSGRHENGEPFGVAPDMAKAIGTALNVEVELVPFASPGEVVDAATHDKWDICLIGAEPARAEIIHFTQAYVEILATYLVPAGSPLRSIADVDQSGVRIAVAERAAYDLWLVANIKQASLHHAQGIDAAFDLFVNEKLEALACLKPRLLSDVEKLPGSRILDGQFTSVQQAIGTHKTNTASAAFLQDFVQNSIRNGFVESLIKKHKVKGLSVAPV
jgi:polar amino acid transport system substrate-binding protein